MSDKAITFLGLVTNTSIFLSKINTVELRIKCGYVKIVVAKSEHATLI